MMIDLEDSASLEKLGNALLNIPSFVVSMTKRAMENQESRDIILNTVFNSDKFVQNVDFALLDSESKVLQRLKDVETVTGLNALYLEDEDHAPTLPERIEALEKNTVLTTKKSEVVADAEKETFIPSGKYEKGAVELVKLAASMKPLDGKKAITCSMFHHFRNNILPEELKPTDKAARVWKQEIIKIVQRIAPDVWIDKKKDQRGNRLAFPRDFNINKLSVSLL
jgi:hypothetical protein